METTRKTCFKCGAEKPLTEFYRHPKMADGRLGKCKTCACGDVKSHRRNPDFREKVLAYDRARGSRTPDGYQDQYRERNPLVTTAQRAVAYAVRTGKLVAPAKCEACGESKSLHGHHHDYSKPLVVVWLCVACHRQHHAMMDLIEKAMKREGAA